ncbi:response regulator [Catenovulum sediminis]|uniref:response regulator n=1 Tax=Catenovulum sediminis TaxID=1740262 RepID=UPI00117D93B4|nr:response regulator [Catenovulum sediminis]
MKSNKNISVLSWPFALLLIICSIGIIFVSELIADKAYQQRLAAQKKELTESVSVYRAQLEQALARDLSVTSAVRSYIAVNPDLTQAEFALYVEQLLSGSNQIKNLGAAKDLVINLIYPFKGNEAALGLDFRKNKAQKDAALLAVNTKNIVIAGPLNLVQGGVGLIAREPVFRADSGDLWGLVSVVIDVDLLLGNAGISNNALFDIALRGKNSTGEAGDVFYGQAELFSQTEDAVTLNVRLPYGSWLLAAKPIKGWLPAKYEPYHLWTTATVFVLCFTLLTLYRIAQHRKSQFQRQIARSERRFRTLFEQNQVVMLLIDKVNGDIIAANSGAKAFYGYSDQDFVQQSIQCLSVDTHFDVQQLSPVNGASHDNMLQSQKVTAKHMLANGENRVVELFPTQIELQDKDILFVVIHDVTKQLENEEHLRDAKHKAELASQSKSRFLANMSHEIRTPMNGIIGLAELVMDTELSAQQHQYLSKLRLSAGNLLHIINDVLDYSKVEAGKLELQPVDFSFFELMSGLSAAVSHLAYQKRVLLLFDVGENNLPQVRGDKLRLHQVLLNLLSNAIKFTEDGKVKLSICAEPLDPEQIQVSFNVSDTGIGIDSRHQQSLFQPFSQADESSTRKYGGTGLGLAISQDLAKLMGAEIQLESEVGKGSSFYFNLNFPVVKAPLNYHLHNQSCIAWVQDSDEVKILSAYAKLLHLKVKHQPIANLGQANELLKHADYCLFDCDLGFEVLSPMLAAAGPLKSRYIAIVGSGNTPLIRALTNAGVDKILLKPYVAEDLYAVLNHQNKDPKNTLVLEDTPLLDIRILLAEDNEINREVAVSVLELLGASVSCAENGLNAVKMVNKQPYDVVLMDIQMPELDGISATEIIRQNHSELPIIAMTAHVMQSEVERCLAAGMNDHLGKPFERSILVEKVLQHAKKNPD